MKKIVSLMLVFITSISLVVPFVGVHVSANQNPTPPHGDSSWELVFSDEFEGTSLDTNKWSYNYPWGNTHNHSAYCVPENVSVSDGLLRIRAENKRHPDAPEGVDHDGWHYLDYTSGAINTMNKFNFTTGYIEGRFKVPSTRGFWPAFWTLNAHTGWPPEIDILEVLCHAPNELHTNYHYGPSWDNKWSHYGHFTTNDLSRDFNTFAVEWAPNYMMWYLNGEQVGTAFRDREWIDQAQEMYLLINMAIGGWEYLPDDSTQWPSYFECD
ncbi:glycoside hydrolase family 16 protein [Herbivorax sp. ANBcel31]|uniref:glycoside hydrolase family 16 protein n=1 Tax=Herbivorax sp. ANBcel31 TaxID=3069754 RepID=UPI0027AE4A57|nr:glycoside hydrolase family 16 protein [Herbivorax sp. ANBcel31]MDQ2086826.1 glycoside hydrolase family 16 protein [Herbivorax sp. ANBcel31]